MSKTFIPSLRFDHIASPRTCQSHWNSRQRLRGATDKVHVNGCSSRRKEALIRCRPVPFKLLNQSLLPSAATTIRRRLYPLSMTPAANGRKIILVLPTPSRFNPPVSVIGLNGCRLGWPSLISMIVFNRNSQVGLHNPMQILSFANVNRAPAGARAVRIING